MFGGMFSLYQSLLGIENQSKLHKLKALELC